MSAISHRFNHTEELFIVPETRAEIQEHLGGIFDGQSRTLREREIRYIEASKDDRTKEGCGFYCCLVGLYSVAGVYLYHIGKIIFKDY